MMRFVHSLMACTVVLSGLLVAGCVSTGAPKPANEYLPPSGYAEGWALDGEVEHFDAETITDHINGEAEIYFPYGFTEAGVATYLYKGDKDRGVAVDLYAMRSSLDAFGIYSNYRSTESTLIDMGTEGFFDGYQLMFYQGRYFTRMSAYGKPEQNKQDLVACAKALSAALPGGDSQPKEVALMNVDGVPPLSVQYIADSVLGLKFFKKGLVGQTKIGEKFARAFVIIEESPAAAKAALDAYVKYVQDEKGSAQVTGGRVVATDPLYKGVLLEQAGAYLVGVGQLKDPAAGEALVAALKARAAK